MSHPQNNQILERLHEEVVAEMIEGLSFVAEINGRPVTEDDLYQPSVEAEVRKRLLKVYNIEIGAGLGELNGKIWRFGIMGYSCKMENVMLAISALESMAVGCPCASTNIGGLKDLPTEKFDNVEELATLMHNCLDFDREEIAKKVSPFSPSNWNIQWEQVLGFLN